MEKRLLGIGVSGRQKAKHPSTRPLVGTHGTNGAAREGAGSGPIKAALKCLRCPAVTPGAMGGVVHFCLSPVFGNYDA